MSPFRHFEHMPYQFPSPLASFIIDIIDTCPLDDLRTFDAVPIDFEVFFLIIAH